MKNTCQFTLPVITLIFFLLSCDDSSPSEIREPHTSEHDREILTTIFRENPGNTLGWDTTDTNLHNWSHVVITEDGDVSGVYLDDKNLTVLPAEVGDLEHLTFLDIAGNALTSLSDEIEKLTKLEQLTASDNDLTSIPAGIKEMKVLVLLKLDHNAISSLPATIGELTNLRWLYLHDNELTAVPEELINLTMLESLALHHNDITSLPQAVCDWGKTLTLSFHVDDDVSCE